MRVSLALCLFSLLHTSHARAGDAPDFDRVVAPILVEHCLDCHSGPRPKGNLDLSTAKTAQRGGKRGPAVVPGKPDDSLLWERVAADRMPPKHPLDKAKKEILRRWLAAGAAWSKPLDPFQITTSKRAGYDWWSLTPLKRPPVPAVKDKAWPRNDIDLFILARLEAEGLTPSPEADRRTLLRRLSFDLIGLPPTPEEVEAFVADKRPDAYERQVERLLASPHHGERWARHWLDVVRFGESDGFERNAARPNAWHYRDWVIKALNADLPYDQFVRLQLAGDVLKPGDAEALKATGYLSAGIHNTVVPMLQSARDTAFQDELEDLVGSVGQTFLGLTVNCGRCHDHKFDPVSQTDYYRLAAALSGVRHGEREIVVEQKVEEAKRLRATLDQSTKDLVALEEPARKALLAERKGGKGPRGPEPIAAWDFRGNLKDQVGGMHVSLQGDARLSKEGLVVDGKKAFARSSPLERDLREKTLEAWVRLDSLDQRGGGVLSIQTVDGGVFDAIVYAEKDGGQWMAGSNFFQRTKSFDGPVQAGKEVVHVAITYAADGTITGYRDGKLYGKPYRSAGLAVFPTGKTVAAFGVRHEPAGSNRMLAGVIVKARLYDRALSAADVAASAERDDFISEADLLARLDAAQREQRAKLLTQREQSRKELEGLEAATSRYKLYAGVFAQPATTRFLHRGQVTDPGEALAAAGISALGAADFRLAVDAPEGQRRLRLAEWITRADNPLFARVMVNRIWHYHFGVGIVDSPSDFGFSGGRPSHPDLLDYLAAEFAARGYRLKDMHRLMVTSSAYRQASLPRKEGLAKDADGRLLWRKRPQRNDGETLRDSMLAIAGLLNTEVGGKGFSDYKETGGAGTSYYDPIDPAGDAFQRRSIYRFQPRSASAGLLAVFDCPDPASAAPRRNMTTTPLQALALWNGPFGLRMAGAFAARLKKEAPEDVSRQVALAYRLAFQRAPLEPEAAAARRLVDGHGLRALCRVILNSNEFVYAD